MFISKVDGIGTMKVIQAIPSMPNPVTESEINKFLENKLNIQIATIDEEGYPMIHPLGSFMTNSPAGYTRPLQKYQGRFRISGEILTRLTFQLMTKIIRTRV